MKERDIRSWLPALPALVALGAGYLLPLAIAFYKSFFAGMSADFVGLENYIDLFENRAFGLAVRNLLRLWCAAVPLNLALGVLLAVLCVEAAGPRLRLAFLFPGILPAACVVMTQAGTPNSRSTSSRTGRFAPQRIPMLPAETTTPVSGSVFAETARPISRSFAASRRLSASELRINAKR